MAITDYRILRWWHPHIITYLETYILLIFYTTFSHICIPAYMHKGIPTHLKICMHAHFYTFILLYMNISILSDLQSWNFNICKSTYLHNCINTSYIPLFLDNCMYTFQLACLNICILAYLCTCRFTNLYIYKFSYLYIYILAYLHNCIFA